MDFSAASHSHAREIMLASPSSSVCTPVLESANEVNGANCTDRGAGFSIFTFEQKSSVIGSYLLSVEQVEKRMSSGQKTFRLLFKIKDIEGLNIGLRISFWNYFGFTKTLSTIAN